MNSILLLSPVILTVQLLVNDAAFITKTLMINNQEVIVTHQIDSKFIGRYSGSKSGYLILKSDGSGFYMNDEPGMKKKDCPAGGIEFEWGFIVSEEGELVKFERPYGYSYPVIYKATGDVQFQGCTKPYLVDYILVKKNGVITISSSSDWVKE